jgi:acyl dehydratase
MPPTWPHVLATPLHLRMLASDAFPVRMLGLVHLAQRIDAAPLPADAALALSCELLGPRETDAGQTFELRTSATLDGEQAWTGVSTFLARRPRARTAGPRHAASGPAADWTGDAATVALPVGADTGRRYARAAGDWNPIHLWRWSARPFGFDRPIAHGMWTLAAAIGAIDVADPGAACRPRGIDVRFGRPLPMPGVATLRHAPTPDGGRRFEVSARDGGRPHASGTVVPLA